MVGCTLCLLSHCLSTLLAESGMCSAAMAKNSSSEPPSVCFVCFCNRDGIMSAFHRQYLLKLPYPVVPNTVDSQ